MTTIRSRRQFVVSTGAGLLLAPFLNVARGLAQGVKVDPIFVSLFKTGGTIPGKWAPTGTEKNFQLSEILSPLENFKDYMTVIGGVTMASTKKATDDPHLETYHVLTGEKGGTSVDQFLATRIGKNTPFSSRQTMCATGRSPGWHWLCQKSGQVVHPEYLPQNEYAALFGKAASGSTTNDAALALTLERQKSSLDFLKDDLGRVKDKLGVEDRQKLEKHLTAFEELEKNLKGTSSLKCGMPAALDYAGEDMRSENNIPKIIKLHMDIIAMAAACGLSRVFTLQMTDSNESSNFPWLKIPDITSTQEGFAPGEYHTYQHAGYGAAVLPGRMKIEKFYMEMVAYLAGKLKAVPTLTGNLLDDSLVFSTTNFSDAATHTRWSMPYVILGKAGGKLAGGRYLKYGDISETSGTQRPHNDLLISLCHAMGQTDVKTYGYADLCNGGLPGLLNG